jgi:hypothetical protein
MAHVLLGQASLEAVIRPSMSPGAWIAPAYKLLSPNSTNRFISGTSLSWP